MITFLSIPRAFSGEFDSLQRRAIRSWQQAAPGCQIILFGDEPGSREAAHDLGVTRCVDLEYTTAGAPISRNAFVLGERYATQPWICYLSADLLMTGSLDHHLELLAWVDRPFVVGRRWDIDGAKTALHPPCGVDWYLYRRGTIDPTQMPPFTVRGGGSDQWFIYKALTAWNMSVIDATKAISTLHYAHSHPEWPNGKAGREGSLEQRENLRLCRADGMTRPYGIDDAEYWMAYGAIVPARKAAA